MRSNCKKLADVGLKGTAVPDENVFKISDPRTDVKIAVDAGRCSFGKHRTQQCAANTRRPAGPRRRWRRRGASRGTRLFPGN